MTNQYKHPLALFHHRFFRITLAIIAATLPVFALSATVSAQSGPDSYCNKYKENSERYACIDGWKGTDCTNYLETHDQKHVDICQESARAAAKAGEEKPDTGTKPDGEGDKETPTKNNSNNTEGLDTVEKLIKQIEDTQRENGSKEGRTDKEEPDNTYGQYINGAGKKQPIRITKAEGNGKPAIIFFNGGGWHSDDRVGDKVAPLAQKRGYTSFVATYRLGSSGVYYMFEDVMRAIKHVRDNAGMYGIDASKIAIWGDSAGGSLAMRAAGSGKSGAAAAVGWSAPTNAYTAIFKSPESFAIGMDHSTCVPTDVNGVLNTIDLIAGGDGNVAPNDGGLGNNNTDTIQRGDTLGTVTQVLTLAQRAQSTGQAASSLASGIDGEGGSGEGSGSGSGDSGDAITKLTTKKFLECLDNFNSASPALFASPLSPPTFLAGFDRDPLIDPGQLYQMRDKLRSMGVASSVLTLPGVVSNRAVAGENHLDYNEAFVNPSLDFLDQQMHVNGK